MTNDTFNYRGHTVNLAPSGFLTVKGTKEQFRNTAGLARYLDDLVEAKEARDAERASKARPKGNTKPEAPVCEERFWVWVAGVAKEIQITSVKRSTGRYSSDVERVYGKYVANGATGQWKDTEVWAYAPGQLEAVLETAEAKERSFAVVRDLRLLHRRSTIGTSDTHKIRFRDHPEMDYHYDVILGGNDTTMWLASPQLPSQQFESYSDLYRVMEHQARAVRGVAETSDAEFIVAEHLEEYNQAYAIYDRDQKEHQLLFTNARQRTRAILNKFMTEVEAYRRELEAWKEGH